MWTATLLLSLAAAAPRGAPSPGDEMLDRLLERSQAQLEAAAVVLADHSSWDDAWEITTRDYAVRTSMNWYLGKRLGDDLEAMLGFFRELGRTEWRPPNRMRVFLFPSLADYNAFGNAFGEHSSMLGSFWASDHPERPVALYFDPNPFWVSTWATHSAFHQFAGQAFPSTPPLWVDEGLASYFAHFYWDPAWGADEFRRVVDGGLFLPLRQLMREPISAYVTPPGSTVDEAHRRFVELGALFAYLLNHREDTRTQYNADGIVLLSPAADYVADLLRGRDVSDHPVHELFTVRLDELEADLRAFRFGR